MSMDYMPSESELDFVPDDQFSDSQIAPHSREAEEAVLGAVLINPEKYFDVGQLISGKDFYIHRHQWIWDAYSNLNEVGSDIDVQTVADALSSMGHLEEIGGKAYLYALISKTPSSMHAESYAAVIAEKSVRRKMIDAAENMKENAFNQTIALDEAIDRSEKSVFEVSEQRDKKEVRPIRDIMGEVYDHVRDLYQQETETVGVQTGLRDLDKLLGGLQKSDLVIVAGRPGMGKTGFLLTVMKNISLSSRKNVAMFSLEMSNEQLSHRLIAQQTGIDTQKLRTGKLSDDELPGFVEAVDVLGSTKIFLDDTPAITPLQLRTKCRRLHLEHHLDLIIIDYLQLMGGESGRENRVQEVSFISRNLKILARELNVPVLTAAQLSRDVEHRQDKKPQLSDLRESGSLEQDADVVIFIHNPETAEGEPAMDGARKLIVAKHRNGPVGEVDVVFLNRVARFENAARPSDMGVF